MMDVTLVADWVTAISLALVSLFTGMTARDWNEPLQWGACGASAIASVSMFVRIWMS
jgi:hypothetical protein